MPNLSIMTNERDLRVKIESKEGRLDLALLRTFQTALYCLRGNTVNDLTVKRFGLGTQTGRLRNSLAIEVQKTGMGVMGIMGTGIPYAAAHEFGTTITPKTRKFLTIPFPGIKGRALEYANTFFLNTRTGGLILFQRQGKSIRPLFTLVKSVMVRQKKWMSKSFFAAKDRMIDIIQQGLREALT